MRCILDNKGLAQDKSADSINFVPAASAGQLKGNCSKSDQLQTDLSIFFSSHAILRLVERYI